MGSRGCPARVRGGGGSTGDPSGAGGRRAGRVMSFLRGMLWETVAAGALGALLVADSSVASAARRALAKCLGQSPPQLVWVVLAFFSWCCGRMNSSLAVMLVSVLPLISVVQTTLDDKALSKAASKLDRTRGSGNSSGDQDSAKAFGNAVLGAMWADFIGPVVAAQVKKALNGTLSKRNFPALKTLEVKQCHAGENPPEIRTCEASVTGDGTLQIMGKMEFHAGHDFIVQLKARWARKLESLPPLAIHITGVRVAGSVLIRASKFTEEKPHVEHLSFSFIEAPKVSFNIEPMGKRSLDITLLPGMSAWLDKLIASGLERHAVWPKKIVVDSSQKRRLRRLRRRAGLEHPETRGRRYIPEGLSGGGPISEHRRGRGGQRRSRARGRTAEPEGGGGGVALQGRGAEDH